MPITKLGNKYKIKYLGKELTTSHYKEMPPELIKEIRDNFFRKPDIELVKKELIKVAGGHQKIPLVTDYFFKDLMAKVKLYTPKWTIQEVIESDELLGYYYSRILASEKVFPPSHGFVKNLATAIRISGGGVAMKPSNFLLGAVDDIINRFNVNNNYYDYSCGWGVRMLSSMRNGVNYYGTDPNTELVGRLNELSNLYNMVNNTSCNVKIYGQGSEVVIDELCGKIGLAFSSPPYYNLEDYRVGNQSYKDGVSYDSWLSNYMKPTIENIKKYLVADGVLAINVKSFYKYNLKKDTKDIIESSGFKYIEDILLKNNTRPSEKKDINTDEYIMIFKLGL